MLLFGALLPSISTGLTPFFGIVIGSLRYFLCCNWSVGNTSRSNRYFDSEPRIINNYSPKWR